MKRIYIGIAVLGIGIVLFLLLRPTAPSAAEPNYQGKPITAWMDNWAAKTDHEFFKAVQQIGTNVLPYVVHNLALNDSAWRGYYSRLQPKLPGLLQKWFPKPKPLLDETAGANVFFYLGSNSMPYVGSPGTELEFAL